MRLLTNGYRTGERNYPSWRGEILRRLVTWANDLQIKVKVITSPRHASEELDGKSLRDFLENINTDFIVVEDIQTHEVENS